MTEFGARSRMLFAVLSGASLLLAASGFFVPCRAQEARSATVQTGESESVAKRTLKPVYDGLRWLVRHQNADGSWSPTTLKEHGQSDAPIYNPKDAYTAHYDAGLTGLALICFLRAGFTPERNLDFVDVAMAKRYKANKVVGAGLSWLVHEQHADGSFSSDRACMSDEAIASLALTTAYALTKDPALKEPAQRSLDFIQAAQRPNPSGSGLWGWRSASRQEIEKSGESGSSDKTIRRELYDSDTTSTGWCAVALESGMHAGLVVGPDNLAGAAAFTRWATSDNGMVGYIDPKDAGATVSGPGDHFTGHPAMISAMGISTRLAAGGSAADPFLALGAAQIMKDLPTISADTLSIDYSYWLWGTEALKRVDGPEVAGRTGKYWDVWLKAVIDAVLTLQDHTEKAPTHGGWMTPDRWARNGGPIYTTAMNVLTLEMARVDPIVK